ncbi:hypothetical protein HYZ05_00975 [Candidatus Daviesbacteria bacterium]|nr:hypothetical protein [Candidatus Daviesbacteria bacterium]
MNTVTLPISIIERVEKKLYSALEEVRALKRVSSRRSSKPVHFWTKAQWEKAEKEADEDIAAGRVVGPFKSAKDLIESLHREAGV